MERMLHDARERLPRGYKRVMKDKRIRDRSGELFQDAFTENESKPRGAVREDVESSTQLDPDVDSQEADRKLRQETPKDR
jgi:hypothetical protein